MHMELLKKRGHFGREVRNRGLRLTYRQRRFGVGDLHRSRSNCSIVS